MSLPENNRVLVKCWPALHFSRCRKSIRNQHVSAVTFASDPVTNAFIVIRNLKKTAARRWWHSLHGRDLAGSEYKPKATWVAYRVGPRERERGEPTSFTRVPNTSRPLFQRWTLFLSRADRESRLPSHTRRPYRAWVRMKKRMIAHNAASIYYTTRERRKMEIRKEKSNGTLRAKELSYGG